MLVQFILFTFLFPYCFTIKNNSYGICYKINLCRKKNEPCHPVVTRCQNGLCRYRYYNSSSKQNLMFANWYYDTNYQRCRRYNHHIENFVYFHFLKDCKRLCPVIRQRKNEKIVNLLISDTPINYNDTIYVHLYIDLSPIWVRNLTDSMNISTQNYNSQIKYFQNYRRHFVNFVNPIDQLILDHQQNIPKKIY